MALIKDLKGTFVGGKISRSLQNRIDLQKFNTWLTEAKNTFIKPEGSISNRAGTVFVGVGKDSTYRLTINVNVSATIIINGVSYTGTTKSVDLEVGSSYTYEVGATGYTTQSGSGTINMNTTVDITLEASVDTYTFSIVATPNDATVEINGTEQSSYTGNSGETVTWEVSKTGYITQTGIYVLSQDHTENVTLVAEPTQFRLQVVTTPNNAVVMINGVETKDTMVYGGTDISLTITSQGYVPISETLNISEDTLVERTLSLSEINLSFTQDTQSNVQEVYSYRVTTDGEYELEIAGKGAFGTAGGGIVKSDLDLNKGDVIKIVLIRNGWNGYDASGEDHTGSGIALYINNSLKTVAGGSCGIFEGGGGSIGGRGDPRGYLNVSGWSLNGTRGNSTVTTGPCGAGAEPAYGGSGYIDSSVASYTTYVTGGNGTGNLENFAYFKLKYIG